MSPWVTSKFIVNNLIVPLLSVSYFVEYLFVHTTFGKQYQEKLLWSEM